MKKFFSISFLNFLETAKDKFFFGIIFFFIFYLAFCIFLGKLSVGHADKVLRDAGLAGIELSAIILIVFSFVLNFFREKENRILEVYLSNVSRSTCISGKIAGYILLSFFYLCFSALGFGAALWLYNSFTKAVFLAVYFIFLKTAIIIGFAALFSCLFSSAVLALLCTLFVYIGSEMLPSAVSIIEAYGNNVQKIFVKALYLFLPNMDKIDIKALAVYGKFPTWEQISWITFYCLLYTLFLWLINLFIFRRKEY
jgi:hypothetical protein